MARGARMVEYWHWHSIHFGHEPYWLGVLNHDGEPGRCYDEVKRIAGEFKRAPATLSSDLVPDADVGAALLAREQLGDGVPSRRSPSRAASRPTAAPTSASSRRFYEGLFGAGLQAEILYAQDFAATPSARGRWPVLVVPALYVADDALLDLLDAYARGGRPPRARLPQRLRRRRGARRARRSCPAGCARPSARPTASTRTSPPRCRCARRRLRPARGRGRHGLGGRTRARGAETLVRYEHPHLGRWPAVTTHAHGRAA